MVPSAIPRLGICTSTATDHRPRGYCAACDTNPKPYPDYLTPKEAASPPGALSRDPSTVRATPAAVVLFNGDGFVIALL
jgi:hypothetical protein